jgi:acyl carrier protein
MKEQQVRDIITGVLKMSGEDFGQLDEVLWDSLTHVSILVKLDTEYEGKLADVLELQDAYTLGNIIAVLRSHNLLT